MNATQAKRVLQGFVKKNGGELEEDNSRPPMRCFQLIAPTGRVWVGNGNKHICIHVDSQRTKQSMEWNISEVNLGINIVSRGHRTMTAQEAFECDEEPSGIN